MVCEFCGYEKLIPKSVPTPPKYNLLITYKDLTGDGAGYPLEIIITDSGITKALEPNTTMMFNLAPGLHKIGFRYKNITYEKTVVTIERGPVVKADFINQNGLPLINIDQPDPGAGFPKIVNGDVQKEPPSVMARTALILSILFFTSGPALVLSAIDIIRSRKAGKPPHSIAIMAFVLSCIYSLILIIVFTGTITNR